MGKLFSLLVLLGLGYAGLYFYYGVVIEKEVEEQLEARGLSSVSVDNVEYDWLAPVSDSMTSRYSSIACKRCAWALVSVNKISERTPPPR